MNPGSVTPNSRSRQLSRPYQRSDRGYALLVVMFLLALLAISVAALSPVLLTQARREKEDEMIWRGKQYERGIKLFYRKNHRIPKSIEELTSSNLGVRFLRKAYKDPMNDADGSWRMIYVSPSGQLIGSMRPSVVFQLGVPGMGTQSALPDPAAQSGRSVFRSDDTNNGFGSQGSGNSSAFSSPASFSASNSSQSTSDQTVFGAGFIGVGSKVNRSSVRWLDGAKNYLQFEFIWDPSKEGMGVNPIRLLTAPSTDSGQTQQTSPISPSTTAITAPQNSSTPQ